MLASSPLAASSRNYSVLRYALPSFCETADFVLGLIHHLGDVPMLTLYPIFLAYALPVKFLKPLTTPKGRYTLYAIGFIVYASLLALQMGWIESDLDVPALLYRALVVLFALSFVASLIGVNTATTKLARERELAFGEITQSHIALIDRLKESLQLSQADASRLELAQNFDRSSFQH